MKICLDCGWITASSHFCSRCLGNRFKEFWQHAECLQNCKDDAKTERNLNHGFETKENAYGRRKSNLKGSTTSMH